MYFRQYDLACLSLYSYMIGDETTGRTVVVDPQRDIHEHLADAKSNDLADTALSIAASLLRSNGFSSVADIVGGYGAWANPVPPTTTQQLPDA